MEDFGVGLILGLMFGMLLMCITISVLDPYSMGYCKALGAEHHDVGCVKDDKIIYKFK